MRASAVLERAPPKSLAYLSDRVGCVAYDPTVATAEANIRESIRFHLDGLEEETAGGPRAKHN